MSSNIKSAKQALNPVFLKQKPDRKDIELFKKEFISLLDRINESKTEEFHKNLMIDFLNSVYYKNKHYINTKDRADLVIHNENTPDSSVGVLIEVKSPGKKKEMVRRENLNVKSFQELVLYYLRERKTQKNFNLRYLIITNIYEWFVFDAQDFEKLFYSNKQLIKDFDAFEAKRLAGTKTDFFYSDIAAPEIEKLQSKIPYTYFNIHKYDKILCNTNKENDKKLIVLYKFLSPIHLLKLSFSNDSNELNKEFYAELLHILGLEEVKRGTEKFIERKKEGTRDSGSILENAIEMIDSMGYNLPFPQGVTNVALDLAITWINRILFMKLLEAQIIKYHKGDKNYAFLSMDKLEGYDSLNSLFFQVLARREADRKGELKTKFSNVPYLNSSLFEITEIETKTIVISNLQNDAKLNLYSGSVLKRKGERSSAPTIRPLEYLLRFLDAYDYSSEVSTEIQEENKPLISASVLGLIFEKINGYKDGSFFTPSFITMYMCRETISKTVIQKFNEAKNWDCQTIKDLYNEVKVEIKDIAEANQIFNTIRICDPAVGSGHFLVSALNEMIMLKSELGILTDTTGKRLKDYRISIENDELIVKDNESGGFQYLPHNPESQRVQEALFHEKQTIIENCLFGVDINPNSVKICQLRLWIELLKHTFYKSGTNELETLPNIDINIKCGNSLISRFALDADLRQALKQSRYSVNSYLIAVNMYRNAENKEQKRNMERLITDIKSDFRSKISLNDPKVKRLHKLQNNLLDLTEPQLFSYAKNKKKEWIEKVSKLKTDIQQLETEIAEIKNNKIYENAFEWRLEFPEVLNEEGDFIGFDAIIGNPPYGVSIKDGMRDYLVSTIGKVPDYEIYYWFMNRAYQLLKKNGLNSYIVPNTILFNVYAQTYRLSLFDKWEIQEILDCTDFAIFNEAKVRNIVYRFTKLTVKKSNTIPYRSTANVKTFKELTSRQLSVINRDTVEANNQNWGLIFKLAVSTLDIVLKIKNNTLPLNDIFVEVSQGLIAYDKYRGQSQDIIKTRVYHSFKKTKENHKIWLYGEDVTRYSVNWNGKEYIEYGKEIANPREPKYFIGKRILIREITNPRIFASLVKDEMYHDPAIIVIKDNVNNKFSIENLLAILNSKLATFYHFNSSPKATKGVFPKILVSDINNFPLPKQMNEKIVKLLDSLVNQILSSKKENPQANTSALDAEIDKIVYELYGLTEEEIKIIEKS
ncbi:hypothetical protein EZS27_020378 [termite gut metagenome]|uniref:site-specific DNA-methyltransferase (adenine-specific) n=1 Tax=termite gut metagenome TaxID=433724 RepID=A0A5J4RDW5_9ZZZZ